MKRKRILPQRPLDGDGQRNFLYADNKATFNNSQCFIALIGLLLSISAFAEETTRHYHIPAQSLNNALMQLAADAHLELMFPAEKLRGLRTDSLDGELTPSQALTRLLQDSGMTYRFVNAKAVTIEPEPNQLRKAVSPEDKPKPQSRDITLPPVSVAADAIRDVTDPYNEDYVLPNATIGTKTDTPIMETPLNVQVISKQVLKDQQVFRLADSLKNVSGVTTTTSSGSQGVLNSVEK